ncbi:MAG TPA: VIT domain-containing protein [Candidatus Xenobia bacterium]|jgi:Ca-activated chloride channel family protein
MLNPDQVQHELALLLVQTASRQLALPLTAIDIWATVADRIACVTMDQTYHNPYDTPLEAVYLFPLPGGAAVREFSMTVGPRVLRATLKAHDEARAEYQAALDQGLTAAMVEETRADVFKLLLGNIPPGESIKVHLSWSERLQCWADGAVELRLPLLLPPRYTSPDQPHPESAPISPLPLKRSLSVRITLLDGGQILDCSRAISTEANTFTHADTEAALNGDFVLRWRAKEGVHGWAGPCEDGVHTCMVTLWPPTETAAPPHPRDIVFLLDRSGSMDGEKLVSAIKSMSILLDTLLPADRFAVLAFDTRAEWLTGTPTDPWVAATESGLRLGRERLQQVVARGSTELVPALDMALGALGRRPARAGHGVIVLITDGQVTAEEQALKIVQDLLDRSRIFTIGVDHAVNAAFLNRLARVGRGTAAMVTPGENLEAAMARIARNIGRPLVHDLAFHDDGAGIEMGSVTPARLPDLFPGRPVTVFFRARRAGRVRLTGRDKFDTAIDLQEGGPEGLTHLWARSRAQDLEDAFRPHGGGLQDDLRVLALQYGVLTRGTAFVVVDQEGAVQSRPLIRQNVAVNIPLGWHGGGVIRCDLLPAERKSASAPSWVALLMLPFVLLARLFGLLRRLSRVAVPRLVRGRAPGRPATRGPSASG